MAYKNKQKEKKWRREYYRKNKEKIKLYKKRWREKNKERLPVLRKKWRDKWRRCIVCGKGIFGSHRMKYCDNCRRKKREKVLKGNRYWKLVKNRPKGKNHWSWRGGITFWKKRIWDSPKYKQWRIAVFKRDNFTCQKCGKKGGNLEAHHLVSFAELLRKYHITSREKAEKCNELWKLELGITFCKNCHNFTKNGRPKKTI